MTGDAFEYAIKKDVRNNPIVREIDRDRHRELWRTMLVGLFFVAVLMFSASRRLGPVHHTQQLDELQDQLTTEERIRDSLLIENEMLRAPARIQRLAREKLHMVVPGPGDHDVILRVMPSPPPPRTAVARREP